ncbi:amidase [Nocardia callitridis]|uniref:amidase n=1 Tax=Nocardia callitridis TaxID=648753 RepID=A0ABP9KLT6_9NOCA
MDLHDVTSAGLLRQRDLLSRGEISATELTAATLDGIERAADLGAFTEVLREAARTEATDRDAVPEVDRGPLHGIPIAIKDEIDVAGTVTGFGTRANSTPVAADAEVVRRLRAAGAIIVGKTTMPEFGQWPFTESSTYGAARNPWDRTRGTGGSSGGSAAAVAAGLVPVAIGGDGGGSIRIPAACCGLFGLKPQRGRVSHHPHPHLWFALGTLGPLTRGVLESAIVYDVIRGNVATDRFRAADSIVSFEHAARTPDTGLRIGYSTKPAVPLLKPDREQVRAVLTTVRLLTDLGHTVFEVDPAYPQVLPAFTPQLAAGVRAEAALVERPGALERRTRQHIRIGAFARKSVVEWAIAHGEKLACKSEQLFTHCDLLLTPTTATRPPRLGALDGVGAFRAQLRSLPMVAYTAPWNVTGNPAASLPAGIGDDGLPLAVQLVAPANDEPTILSVAAQLEQARPHPRPPR